MGFPDNLESLLKKFSKIDKIFHVKTDPQSKLGFAIKSSSLGPRRAKLSEKVSAFFLLESVPFFSKSTLAQTSLKY